MLDVLWTVRNLVANTILLGLLKFNRNILILVYPITSTRSYKLCLLSKNLYLLMGLVKIVVVTSIVFSIIMPLFTVKPTFWPVIYLKIIWKGNYLWVVNKKACKKQNYCNLEPKWLFNPRLFKHGFWEKTITTKEGSVGTYLVLGCGSLFVTPSRYQFSTVQNNIILVLFFS